MNRISCISKCAAHDIVAIGENFGMLKLFKFPHFSGPALRAIASHTYKLSQCMFTKDNQALITYSEYDRALIKWRIVKI